MLLKDTTSCPRSKLDGNISHLRLLRVRSRIFLDPLPISVARYLKAHRWCQRCAERATKIAFAQSGESGPDFVWTMRGVGMRIAEAKFIWFLAEPVILGGI